MTALTVGVTTAKNPECKRGVATNIAASLARHSAVSARVCVVDADPLALDVTTRLAVGGPVLEDFARPDPPSVARLGRVGRRMAVLPAAAARVGRVHLAAEPALPVSSRTFDVVVCDLPGGPSGPGSRPRYPARAARLARAHGDARARRGRGDEPLPRALPDGRDRGDIGPVQLALVCTGDESSAVLSNAEVEAALGRPVAVRVPQLWGRAEPNRGFGAALAIPELDDAVYDLFAAFRDAVTDRRAPAPQPLAGSPCSVVAREPRRRSPLRARKLPLAHRDLG